MIKKTIEYTDLNGNTRKDDFYFHINKGEMAEMAAQKNGEYGNYLAKIAENNNITELMEVFKELILKSYGVRSEDGLTFEKEDDNGNPLWKKFYRSEAYGELLMELIGDSDKAAAFVNGVIPKISQSPVNINK